MDAFWKTAAILILTIIFGVTIGKTEKDISVVLSVVACCMIFSVAIQYLSDVIAFLWKLANSSGYKNPFMETLLKITGIALMTELTGLLSADAGNSSLGKAMQILGTSAILFLSLPIFESFFSVIQEIVRML